MTEIFICLTPLHIITAEKILEVEKIKSAVLLYIPDQNSKQHRYYFDRVSKEFRFSFYCPIKKNIFYDTLQILKCLKKLNLSLKKTVKPNIFIGNLRSIYPRLFIMSIDFSNIYTFDDGFANLLQKSFLHKDEKFIFRCFFKLFNPSLQYANIKNNIKKHYSIFSLKYQKNNHNKVFIKLFDFDCNQPQKNKPLKKVLLSAPFFEYNLLTKKEEQSLYNYIVDQFEIDCILKHPNEQTIKKLSRKIDYAKTLLIAEEFISNLTNDYRVKVYGFYSTALINIALTNQDTEVFNIHYDRIHTKDNKRIFDSFEIKTVYVKVKSTEYDEK